MFELLTPNTMSTSKNYWLLVNSPSFINAVKIFGRSRLICNVHKFVEDEEKVSTKEL